MAERITRADVVQAALRLLDQGGIPALAMRRIAGELGVQQSALYWHVADKQTLLAAVADEIVAEVAATTGDTWRDRVGDLSLQLRAALLRHRDGAELVSTALAFRLGADAMVATFGRELAASGADPDDVETAGAVLVHFTLGYTTDEQQHRQAAELGAIGADPDDRAADATARFTRGIDLILDGLATAAPRSRPS